MSFKRVVEPGKTASGRQRTMDECCFTSTETVGLLGTGAQDVHFDFHTAPELDYCVDDDDNVEINVLGCQVDIIIRNKL